MTTPEYRLFSLGSNPKLADEIANILGTNLSDIDVRQFADDEIYERIEQTVRGRDVYVIQGIS
ncbi:ribose-phosphate pyrophosphokinase-like domain-containing protein, partial [uncultured Leuconostoc sp.]